MLNFKYAIVFKIIKLELLIRVKADIFTGYAHGRHLPLHGRRVKAVAPTRTTVAAVAGKLERVLGAALKAAVEHRGWIRRLVTTVFIQLGNRVKEDVVVHEAVRVLVAGGQNSTARRIGIKSRAHLFIK